MADFDLTHLLREWPHESGRINARLITGHDGRAIMQVRIELGVLQLEITGRPDGLRPENHESLLEYQLGRRDRYGRESGSEEGFVLSPKECRALREEAVQFYHRYLGLFVLERYDEVVRDVERNLQVVKLCRDNAAEEHDQQVMNQFVPHLVMMRTRALATQAVTGKQPKVAMQLLDDGIVQLQAVFEELGAPDSADSSNEMQLLRGLRDALVPKLPMSQRVELQDRLQAALDAENYELAAILRDELRMMRD